MQISLIEHTGKGRESRYAAALLIFIKNLQWEMKLGDLESILNWTQTEIIEQLTIITNADSNAFQFIDYTFLIEDISFSSIQKSPFLKSGLFAQQETQASVSIIDFEYTTGQSIEDDEDLKAVYDEHMHQTNDIYNWLVENGANENDARGVLPTAIKTNITIKLDLKTIIELSQQTQKTKEGQEILYAIIGYVAAYHPWTELFIQNKNQNAEKLRDFINRGMGQMELAPNEGMEMLNALDSLIKN